jgi:hypothetical protein
VRVWIFAFIFFYRGPKHKKAMSPNKYKMEQEEEYKNAVAMLSELEKQCLGESSLEKVRVFGTRERYSM